MTAILALLLAAVAFVWFLHLEREGRPVTVAGFVLGLVIVESALYQSQNEIPVGIFHPEIQSLSFRLLDVVIPAAVLARLLHRTPVLPQASGLVWLALLAWLATAGVIGIVDGNPPSIVAFHAKVIIYLGAFLLTAGVPLREYLVGGRLERYLGWTAGLALLLVATDVASVSITADLPVLPLQELGTLGSDIATIFTGLGALALALGLFASRRRGQLLGAAVVLLFTPAVADQRAAFIALALSLAVVLAGALVLRRPLRVTPTEGALALAGVTALLLVSALPKLIGDQPVKLPLQAELTTTFASYEEFLTTRDRLNQWSAAAPLISERPIFGWGLGKEYTYYDPGHLVFRRIDLTHNILGDLLLRSGAVGLALFLLALAGTSIGLLRTWWTSRDDGAAAFALGTAAVVAGLLGKGLAESIFEKYRLAVVLGLGIGTMLATGQASPGRRAARSPGRGHAPARPTAQRGSGTSASRRACADPAPR